jgi:hypothetical protein
MKNINFTSVLATISILVLTTVSCNLVAATSTTVAPNPSVVVPVTGATATETVAATDTATQIPATDTPLPPTLAPTATSSAVTVTAAPNGSLGILRGDSTFYDVMGYLQNGQTSTASARNSDGTWLYIYVPNYPTVFGWAFIGSVYSTVQGDVNSLPVKFIDPAVPAYIRNCTFHPMLIQPGNVLLQPQTDLTNRQKQFQPGTYTAYDQSAQNKPLVLSVTLKEGVSVDIVKDGLKNTYTCP